MHRDLVGALLCWVDPPQRAKTCKFLRGLALDELRFLASFCGACILESSGDEGFRTALAARIAAYRTRGHAADQDLKMILLLEYLNRSGLQSSPAPDGLVRDY